MVQAKVWILRKKFDGFPKKSDFELKVEQLPELRDGEILLEAVFFSVDPYMRFVEDGWMKEGNVMAGTQVAKVLKSRNPSFPVGSNVVSEIGGPAGWRTHTVCDGTDIKLLPKDWPADVPLSVALGGIGMPGLTALHGLEEVCHLKAGETLLVSAAAGAVGMMVGQIAKLKGCRVIGSAGSEAKVAYLKELGFDKAFNYKTVPSLEEALKEASPEGYDCFFDNVGGAFLSAALPLMKPLGRIAICGAISTYNDTTPQTGPYQSKIMIMKMISMVGFTVFQFKHKNDESLRRLLAWKREGKLKCREHVVSGFENMPTAFMGMLRGENLGKVIVKA